MHEFLTDLGKEAYDVARKVAGQSGSKTILPIHLLIGVLSIDGALQQVLEKKNLRANDIKKQIALSRAKKPSVNPTDDPTLTTVFNLAREEGCYTKFACVGTDHLFLALLKYNQGKVAEIFKKLGLTYKQFQEESSST